MRLIAPALALSLGLLASAVPAVAQDAAVTGETEAQRAARRAAMPPPVLQEDEALKAAISASTRPAADVARDSQRHPYESLTFWGLNPGQTIVEISPGAAGWWRNILEPYAQATGGKYVPVNNPAESMGVEDGSADVVLVARAFHNWARAGRTEPFMQAFFKALKPGGVLAVEQHRSVDGLNVADTAPTGYVPESYVIHAAQAAGFVLEARSEINANSKDDRDHPFGVWSLPPVRQSAARDGTGALTPEARSALDAVGESDRMTLRFRKPA